MPPEIITVDHENLITEKARRITLYRRYVSGNPPFPRLDVQDPNRDKPRFVVGYPRMIVERYVDALFGREQFGGFDAFSFSDEGFSELFSRVWEENSMDVLLDELAQDSILCGEGYVDVVYNSEELGGDRIALRRYSPELVEVVTNAVGDVLQYVLTWFDAEQACWWRKLIYPHAVYTYRGEERQEEIGRKGIFREPVYKTTVAFTLQHDLSVEHNLGFFTMVRVVHGTPLFEGALPKLDALNELFTNIMYAISQQADPLLYVKGISRMDEVYKDADAVWYFTNPQASIDVLQWQGTPPAIFEAVKHITAQLFRVVGIPIETVLETKDIIDKPYRSLRLLYNDFLARVSRCRRDYEIFFNDLWRTVAMLAAAKGLLKETPTLPASELACSVSWGDVIEEDMASWREFVVEKLYGKGLISKARAIRMMGFDDEEELLNELEELERSQQAARDEELRLMLEKTGILQPRQSEE